MANTFKFGNGNWAVKDGYALAYNDENNNFKPLPFDFTRASSATRVNKQGLIETVGSGKPRIDFLDNTKGHLLLEPSRTNYSIYSQDTSTWTYTEFGSGSAGTITTGKTDMFGGTNAVQVDFPSNAENVSVRFGHTSSSISSGTVSLTLYIKLVSNGSKNLQLRASTSDIINVNSTEFVRYEVSGTKSSTEALQLKLRPSDGTSSGGFSIIICHPQEEVGSYATSYIPTEGSSVTRSKDDIDTNYGDINSLSGEVSVYFNLLPQVSTASNTNKCLSFGFNSSSNANSYAVLRFNGTNWSSRIQGTTGNNFNDLNVSQTTEIKAVMVLTQSGYSLYANGSTAIASGSYGGTAPTINSVAFVEILNDTDDRGIYKIKELKVYNTALTEAEAINLTS